VPVQQIVFLDKMLKNDILFATPQVRKFLLQILMGKNQLNMKDIAYFFVFMEVSRIERIDVIRRIVEMFIVLGSVRQS
jgi:hypothetical protein